MGFQDREPSPGPVKSGAPTGDPLVAGVCDHDRESCCSLHVRACSRRLFRQFIRRASRPSALSPQENRMKIPEESKMIFEQSSRKREFVNRKVHPTRVHAVQDVPSWTEPGHNPGRPPLSDRPPHTRRNRHRTRTSQRQPEPDAHRRPRTRFTPVQERRVAVTMLASSSVPPVQSVRTVRLAVQLACPACSPVRPAAEPRHRSSWASDQP